MEEAWLKPSYLRHAMRLLNSYKQWTGRELLPEKGGERERAQSLFEAPFAVVSHGTEADPILNYGNRAALDLWDMTWDSFIHTPSRLTAELLERQERAALLEEVSQKGFSEKYRGIRVSHSGRRFRLEDAVVWNILDESGRYCGQAAKFEKWTYL